MSEIKHTPGPWTVYRGDWSEDGNARYEIEGIRSINAADGRLISAAPDLLEALLALDDLRGAWAAPDDVIAAAWSKCRAAIAKATGA